MQVTMHFEKFHFKGAMSAFKLDMIVDWFVILLEIYKLLNTIWLHRINCLFVSAYSNNPWHLIKFLLTHIQSC